MYFTKLNIFSVHILGLEVFHLIDKIFVMYSLNLNAMIQFFE